MLTVVCERRERWKKTGMPEFKPGFWASYYECLKFATLMKIAIPFNGFSWEKL